MPNNKNRFVAGFLLLALALLAACSAGHPSLPPPTLQTITVTPAKPTLKLGRSLQMTATGHYSYGADKDLTTTVTWSNASSTIVSVSSGGLAYAGGTPITGTPVTITATDATTAIAGTTTVTLIPDAFTISGGASVNDPLVSYQWHLKNWGQTPACAFADTACTTGFDINAEPVYNNTAFAGDCGSVAGMGCTGYGVKVAVVDTGLEIAHEDLAANVILNGSWNFNNGTTDPTNPATDGDHGTSVAGLIASQAYNGKGGMGVAPEASLKGFNFLISSQSTAYFIDSLGGSTSNPNSSDVAVFNQSYGIALSWPISEDPLIVSQYQSGVGTLRSGLGAVYVKAAGNDFSSLDTFDNLGNPIPAKCSPANNLGISCANANFDPDNVLPYNIVVGALNASGVKSSYSTTGSALWVSAPGGEYGANSSVVSTCSGSPCPAIVYQPAMVTTDQSSCTSGYATTLGGISTFSRGITPNGNTLNASCNYTNNMNGTSSATPVTSGVIALMLEANPNLTWRDVKHILASTARKVDAGRMMIIQGLGLGTHTAEHGWTVNSAGYNYHNWYGFGLVDASAAVAMAKGYAIIWPALVTTGWSSNTTTTNIPDSNAAGASTGISLFTAPTFIEAVQIEVSISHSYWGDLGIELTSPSGTKSILKNIRDGFDYDSTPAANPKTMVLLSNAFYGENSNNGSGTGWTIRVVDGNNSTSTTPSTNSTGGTLVSWAIRIYGH